MRNCALLRSTNAVNFAVARTVAIALVVDVAAAIFITVTADVAVAVAVAIATFLRFQSASSFIINMF
jgi:hypothetical protein